MSTASPITKTLPHNSLQYPQPSLRKPSLNCLQAQDTLNNFSARNYPEVLTTSLQTLLTRYIETHREAKDTPSCSYVKLAKLLAKAPLKRCCACAWLEQLATQNPPCKEAIIALGALEHESSMATLLQLINDKECEKDVVKLALQSLCEMPYKPILGKVMTLITDESFDLELKFIATQVLLVKAPETIIKSYLAELLEKTLNSPELSTDMKVSAIEKLPLISEERALCNLLSLLNTRDDLSNNSTIIKAKALDTLQQLQGEEGIKKYLNLPLVQQNEGIGKIKWICDLFLMQGHFNSHGALIALKHINPQLILSLKKHSFFYSMVHQFFFAIIEKIQNPILQQELTTTLEVQIASLNYTLPKSKTLQTIIQQLSENTEYNFDIKIRAFKALLSWPKEEKLVNFLAKSLYESYDCSLLAIYQFLGSEEQQQVINKIEDIHKQCPQKNLYTFLLLFSDTCACHKLLGIIVDKGAPMAEKKEALQALSSIKTSDAMKMLFTLTQDVELNICLRVEAAQQLKEFLYDSIRFENTAPFMHTLHQELAGTKPLIPELMEEVTKLSNIATYLEVHEKLKRLIERKNNAHTVFPRSCPIDLNIKKIAAQLLEFASDGELDTILKEIALEKLCDLQFSEAL